MLREPAVRSMAHDTNQQAWWRRLGSPDEGFRYVTTDGAMRIPEQARHRIDELPIPPAWTHVHISPDPERKVQAWGRDAAGRDRKSVV